MPGLASVSTAVPQRKSAECNQGTLTARARTARVAQSGKVVYFPLLCRILPRVVLFIFLCFATAAIFGNFFLLFFTIKETLRRFPSPRSLRVLSVGRRLAWCAGGVE